MSLLAFSEGWDLSYAMNGLLAGLVATCSGVNVYSPVIAVSARAGAQMKDEKFANQGHHSFANQAQSQDISNVFVATFHCYGHYLI